MAQYVVRHACGHTHDYNLTGPGAYRENRLAWLQKRICPRCYVQEEEGKGPLVYLRSVSEGTEIVIAYSYPVRGILKARGYRFGYYHVEEPADMARYLCSRGTPGWARWCSPLALPQELAWIDAQHWRMQRLDGVHGLFAAVGEGRPELAGIDPNQRAQED